MTHSDAHERWLKGDAYDALRARDFALFVDAAAQNLDAPVPTCPDWNVSDLCDHLARVYQGRTFTINNGTFADPKSLLLRGDDVHPLDWLRTWSANLDAALSRHADTDATVTFMDDCTSMHFWRRRMALETLVHRTDAELAVGRPISTMDDDLSADGVAELLWFCSDPRNDRRDSLGEPTSVALVAGERRFVATVSESTFDWHESDEPTDAEVRAAAGEVLLALSGRDVPGLSVTPDGAAWRRLLDRAGVF